MTEKIDIEFLSQQFIELWQNQLQKALTDPLLQKSSYEMMAQFQEMMKNNVSLSTSNFAFKDKSETNAGASSTSFDGLAVTKFMGSLVERIELCEKRLEQFESFFSSFQPKAS